MQWRARFVLSVFAAAATASLVVGAQDFQPEEIIALERAALDRWSNGASEGYLRCTLRMSRISIATTERRVDGIEAMRALLTPLTGQFRLTRYEILAPDVYRRGDLAVLSYNLSNLRHAAERRTGRDALEYNVRLRAHRRLVADRSQSFLIAQAQFLAVPAP